MKIIEKCEVCGSKDIKFLLEQTDKNLNINEQFSLYKCQKCSMIFLNPQLSYKELDKYYPNEEYYSLKGIDVCSKKLKLRLFLYDLYFNPDKKNIFLRIIFSPLKFSIRGATIEKGKKFLDIGSGSGQFLYEMKNLGMSAQGVEPGEFNRETNRKYNLNIKNTDLIKAKYPRESFDLITMNHVLEHINNPNETIKEINRIIKSKGLLIIGVPNSNSLAYKIFKKNWHQLDVPRHLFNYSDKNIKILIEKHGFKILKIRYNSRPNQFVTSLFFLLGIKKRKGLLNRILELIFLPLTWLVNALRIGDQIEIWCVKK